MATSERTSFGDPQRRSSAISNSSNSAASNYGACSTSPSEIQNVAECESEQEGALASGMAAKGGLSPSNELDPQPGPSGIRKLSKDEKKLLKKDGTGAPRTKSNQRWMKLRTTVQLSGAISNTRPKPPLKREDSFLQRFSTRQMPNAHSEETIDRDFDTDGEDTPHPTTENGLPTVRRKRKRKRDKYIVNPDESFYFVWLTLVTSCVLYNVWTTIVRESFPELQSDRTVAWIACDIITDVVFAFDIFVQFRTGYLEQGLMVYDLTKLARHYKQSRDFVMDIVTLIPVDLIQFYTGMHPILRFPRFLKIYRACHYYYIVESRTIFPNVWRVLNLVHILLILAHWFGCFYYLLSEAEGFKGDWVYPYHAGEYATLTRKYLGSVYWSTLTLTTIGDLPTPETNVDRNRTKSSPETRALNPRRSPKSRLLQIHSLLRYIFTIISYLIGVFIFATIVGQVGNVITNRNANRLEFERLLDGAKTYMRHHKVPGEMKKRVLRWYDYSWSRGRIQGGGDINTALGLLPDKLKTELALHVNLSVLKKVTIFQECQPEFLHDLVLKMKAYIFTPGDLICRKGEVAREMFIIADGILDVMSECGRVMTTMRAGDFFGEIGILNLDGLNRRTADVRSVGYSELFSLSREDVLSAMKDYPEAEQILETLGRKRLAEARRIAKLFKAAKGEATSPIEDATGKKIVDKLKSDVKGLKNALKRSKRDSRSKDKQIMLTRMSHVQSSEEAESPPTTPPPLGAGLPLLQRLKLLKEKQDREKAAAAAEPVAVVEEKCVPERDSEETGKTGSETQAPVVDSKPTVRIQVTGVRFEEHRIKKDTNSDAPKTDACKKETEVEKEVKKKEGVSKFKDALKKLQPRSNEPEVKKTEEAGVAQKSAPARDTWGMLKKSAVSKVSRGKKRYMSKSDTVLEKGGIPKKRSNSGSTEKIPRKSLKLAVERMMKDRRRTKSLGMGSSKDTWSTSVEDVDPNAWEFSETGEIKRYDSVNDLSPEYSDLPFVKKLDILNQKQAEQKSRSMSFDEGNRQFDDEVCLIRSQSEASAIQHHSSRSRSASCRVLLPPAFLKLPPDCIRRSDTIIERALEVSLEENLSSPDSNETLERRKLKSILKRISSEDDDDSKRITVEERKELMRAQTVEGYAARHSKLAKSVTFNHGTLDSPPVTPTPATTTGTQPDVVKGLMEGMQQVMGVYLNEIESKFQTQFRALQDELRHRDELILDLQSRIASETSMEGPREPSNWSRGPRSVQRTLSLPGRDRTSALAFFGGAVETGRFVRRYSAQEEIELRAINPAQPINQSAEDYSTVDVESESDDELHNQNWEIEMLVKEMERRSAYETQIALNTLESDVENLKKVVDNMDLENLSPTNYHKLKATIRQNDQKIRRLSSNSLENSQVYRWKGRQAYSLDIPLLDPLDMHLHSEFQSLPTHLSGSSDDSSDADSVFEAESFRQNPCVDPPALPSTSKELDSAEKDKDMSGKSTPNWKSSMGAVWSGTVGKVGKTIKDVVGTGWPLLEPEDDSFILTETQPKHTETDDEEED